MKYKSAILFSALGYIVIHVGVHLIVHYGFNSMNSNQKTPNIGKTMQAIWKVQVKLIMSKRKPNDFNDIPLEGNVKEMLLSIGLKNQAPNLKDFEYIDEWKSPLYYIKKGDSIIIYSFGPNKINEHAKNDDIFNEIIISKINLN